MIGYIHAGFQLNRNSKFLDDVYEEIKDREFAWKEEALYDIAVFFEEMKVYNKASEIYRLIMQLGDEHWKNMAEYRLLNIGFKN